VEIYESERDQIEALKKWWKENGRVVSLGLVIGLGSVFGWTSWKAYATAQAEKASVLYQQMISRAGARDFGRADELAEALMRDFSSSGYAELTGLVRANSAFARNQLAEARGYLQWVIDTARRPELKAIARLRLARLLLDDGDATGATALLDAAEPGTLIVAYEELRGDIAFASSDPKAAAERYMAALAAEGLSSAGRARIQMKLDDLGLTSAEPPDSQ